ncbi:ATP-binding protein [Streptacidiphilus fuscans]|uniref:ATP-binding protein n=1 Tax=Streptacidiphilus fuscans TaxID=2789292 RepID=A0A931BCV1_9ACTN|nr:ATP-binding protein [Streptacidiphilus fuscans]MBF9071873.1 ATP-binding protein [Streptacidiphilus fuscans]
MTGTALHALARTWVVVRDPSSVPLVRRRVVDQLTAWQIEMPTELTDDIRLVVSELVTNAVRYDTSDTPTLTTQVVVAPDRSELYFEVQDGTPPDLPTPRPARWGPEDELTVGGRGLLLVAARAKRWNIEPTEGGKRVWATFALPTTPNIPQRVRDTVRAHVRRAAPRIRIHALPTK